MRSRAALIAGIMLVLLFAGLAFGDIHPIPLGAGRSHLTLLGREGDALRFRIEVGELAGMDVETPEGTFTRLFIPGFHSSKAIGDPELPMMNRLVEIPYGAETRVEILSIESKTLHLDEYGIEHPLMPAQPSMPKNADPDTWPFAYNRSAYSGGRIAREPVAVTSLGRLRAVDLGRVEVSPVEYDPVAGEIIVHEAIEFRIVFEGIDAAAGERLDARLRSSFFEPLYEQVAGYAEFRSHDLYPDVVRDVVTYAVIVPAEFEAMMQSFVDWKTERGFTTIVGVIGSPEVGTTTSSIQSYIAGLYNNPPAGQPAPSFVLFVGDIAQCPSFSTSNGISDRPYCDIDGDLVPDIYYGRFSATSMTQLQNILDKSLMYDQFTMPDPSYLGDVVMIAGVDAGHAPTWGNGQINYGTNNYFNAAHGINSYTYLYPDSDAPTAPAEIVQHVSDGVAFINYTAHGSETSWSDPYFSQSNVNSLQNSGEYCLAIGNCCLTSSYQVGECFAETWLRAADKGAIGYIGGSNSTYWDEDYWWGVGYGSIIANPTYEATGLGAYDGLFHDHGEPMDNWYVVNDAIIFSGNLAVMEAGSSLITYYWNIYNLMGDPSIATYLGVPGTNTVVHPSTIFTTTPSITIQGAAGSYCGLTQGDSIAGAGTIDSTGEVVIPIGTVLAPGSAHLVVMAQNKEPYVTDIPVIVPATILIDPDTIQAGGTSIVHVTVLEADGVTPKPGIAVWADGLGYETTPVLTDSAGMCTLSLNYPYGPSIDIAGKDPAETWELFREPVTVLAGSIPNPDLWVTTTIGLSDTFALNLEGVLHMSSGDPRPALWAILPDGTEVPGGGSSMAITPAETGEITGVIAVTGCDLYTETFPVIEAYGTLAGHVDAAGSPAAGAVVRGYDLLDNLVFEATADGAGDYDVGEEILVASYVIRVDFFGYLAYDETTFVNYGANTYDINLTAAPSGVLTGTITDSESGVFLYGSVKVYRSDTMGLYTETYSDSTDGTYTTAALPYFDYVVVVKAWHHRALTIDITIEDTVTVKDFALDPTVGDLLVLDDGSKGGANPAKLDEKGGAIVADPYVSGASKAAADLVTDLQTIGYEVTLETASGSDPLTWSLYDVVILSSGDNTSPVASPTVRANVESFVLGGGHLLVEGGETGYDAASSPGYPTFATNVLHSNDWNHDQSGNVTVADAAHYVMSVPNVITGPISMTYSGYGDQDAMVPNADADRVGSWSSYPTDASLICYDPNPAPEGGQIVYYCFNYSAMDATIRPLLVENTITWLMTPEYGNCSVSGTATLAGQADHSGILVEAVPGGGSVYTGPTGAYTLPGLYAGTYDIVASKDGWATGLQQVSLSDGQDLTGVDFLLTPTMTSEMCENPSLAIPDNDAAGVRDTCLFSTGGTTVTAVEVFVDITHTYIGDLIVSLISPAGTTVILHNQSGGSADNLYGWYPGDLTPDGDLDDFIGDPADGAWVLHVSDNAGYDVGVLNTWCVRLTHDVATGVTGGRERLPRVLALGANVPNPFNPTTTIRFDLPRPGGVRLAVYEASGRRVATLVSEPMDAGSHAVTWSGRDDRGRAAASGVYFYRLEAEGKTLTKKMVLLK